MKIPQTDAEIDEYIALLKSFTPEQLKSFLKLREQDSSSVRVAELEKQIDGLKDRLDEVARGGPTVPRQIIPVIPNADADPRNAWEKFCDWPYGAPRQANSRQANLTSKLEQLLEDNSDPFRRSYRAALGKQVADLQIIAFFILGFIVLAAIVAASMAPH